MSLIPSTIPSTGTVSGLGWPPTYGPHSPPLSTVSAATKGSSNFTASPNHVGPLFLTQEAINRYGRDLPVVSVETNTTLPAATYNPIVGKETLGNVVSRWGARRRESYGIDGPISPLPSTTSPSTTSPSTTSPSKPHPPSTAPPVLSGKYDHGVFVPDIKLLTNVVSNNKTLGNTTFPLWIGLKGNYEPYPELMTGVKPELRGTDRTKVFRLVGYSVVIEPVANMPQPNKPNEHGYNDTLASYYVSNSCNFEDPEKCVMMCSDYDDIQKYFKLVDSKITLIGGGNKNVYSRRKLNKTKSKRKTTKRLRSRSLRRRSLRSRRNIIRKTKKMYK